MAKKQFKAESKRLLDLMVNSIYTHKEIFLREIISNASDAIDKLCYISLTDDNVGLDREDFAIELKIDRDARTITVSDNGVGMTADELEKNLGVIAKSGSLKFKKDNDVAAETDIDIIGQFGVGFYSAFMVAKRVTVISRAYGENTANRWESQGADGYTIAECEKETAGTEVIMELKDDTEDENYSDYLEESVIYNLIKKYSDYIRWPIITDVTKSRQVESGEVGADGKAKRVWEDYTERETINSRVPLWQRPKSEVSDDECKEFYKNTYYEENDPVSVIRVAAEGTVSYKAMLFIPSKAPYDYFSRDYKPGVQLYSSGVMIMDRCADLLPEHFNFVRGVVDSPDLSLNISREILQHDRQLKVIAGSLEKKVRAELNKLMENDMDKYREFYSAFGIRFKYSILNHMRDNMENLAPLLLFYSYDRGENISVKQYVEAMPESQKYIYYACGDNIERLKNLPQAELVRSHGYDILLMTDEIDDFLAKSLGAQEGFKEFRSIDSDDLELESDEDKAAAEKAQEENAELLAFVVEALEGKVASAKISNRLVSHPVCLATEGQITLEMERYFASIAAAEGREVKATRVLEINAGHAAFEALKNAFAADKDRAADYAKLLYAQSLLIAGLPIEDPVAYSELVCKLM